MRCLDVKTERDSYKIYIATDIFSQLNKILLEYDKILFLTNETIDAIYNDSFFNNFISDKIEKLVIKDGETYKNIDTAMEIYTFMIENNFSRKSLIVCVGGGVVCDTGGFVASTYMRGIDFLQIPTSLLAQVDASIGGKVAINHPKGKNIIGTFKQPIAVLINPEFLKTLPKEEFNSGMCEVIKHAIISKKLDYFNFLLKNYEDIKNLKSDILEEMIFKSCEIKKEIVERDEFERGERAFLNLGHTYAHTLEALFNFKNISHGTAVAKGVIFELYLSKELGFIDDKYIDKIKNIFKLYDIKYSPIYLEEKRVLEVMKKDKKNLAHSINFIIDKEYSLENISISEEIILKVNSLFKNHYLKGVIDIGTNSCRLFIAEVEIKDSEIKIITPLYKDLDISRLGKNLNKTKVLSEESIEKTFSIIQNFKQKAFLMGVTELTGFATAATREAKNGQDFIKSLKEIYGVNTYVIPGELEAKLSFNGNIASYDSEIAVLDVGGGSTEVTIGSKENIRFIKSFSIGVVKLTEMFFANQSYSEENMVLAQNYLNETFKELKTFRENSFKLIGVAGTVTTNVSIVEKLSTFDEKKINGYELSRKDIADNLKLFISLDMEKRRKIVGLKPDRADIIIAGNLILLTVLDIFNKNSITVSTKDNLEGAMVFSKEI